MGARVIDLFRPFVDTEAALRLLRATLTPTAEGRLYIGEGALVKQLELLFADLVGVPLIDEREPPVLAVNSCSSALALALQCCDVGPGDVVLSTPITCTATNGAIVNRGARIVWCDVDPSTGNLDPEDVRRKAAREQPKALVAVDWAGRACDYHALRQAASGVPIIEDAAHALLAEYRGAPIALDGGDYVCWSLGPIKHLTSGGEGGMLLVRPKEQRRRARLLRWHGLDRRSSADFRCAQDIEEAGHRFHLTDLPAALGLANLPHARWIVSRHRENAAFYDRALKGIPGVTLPPPDEGCSSWLYSLLADDRDGFQARMTEQSVATSQVHAPNTKHTAFRRAALNAAEPLPGVEAFGSRQVAIPVGWWLTSEDRERVAEAVWSSVKVAA
jgi:dTDP-4-amino-4,6-dideoxygalactose transaminase